MDTQIRLLSTKKLTDYQKQLLLNANFSVAEADFINVVNQSFDLKSSNDYLIFTSQNAVESILENEKATEL
ncbi:MAG: uroporphyrinogen-III synthase, partial [Flavobacterium sp.]